MQLIGTHFLTQYVKDWLGNSSHPRILHVFDRACNLINEHGEILSIVTSQIGRGPFNLVVQNEVLFSNDLNVNSPISISGNQLTLGNLIIDIADAQLWNPRPDWQRLHAKRDHIVEQLESLPITEYSNLFIFAMPLNHRNPQPTNSLISNLSSALAKANTSSATSIASKIAGLGVGLTPSGDDFMMGALYAVWIIHPPEIAGTLAQEIANSAAPLTTSLSAAWLKSAGRGEAGILWHEFFDALSVGQVGTQTYAMDKILAIGATSGADALAGFIGTFIAYRELEKKYVIPKFL